MDRLISEEKWEHISKLSEIRSKYSCFEDDEEPYYRALSEGIKALKAIPSEEPKVGRCEDCKCFRKLSLRTDTVGKCIQHWGVCPPCDWYCADFEPQESEE